MAAPLAILVDADACPVKEEIYKVAYRHEVPVRIVTGLSKFCLRQDITI